MRYYSYKIEHDYGLAPNPFGQYCTLVVCKPTIRNNKNLEIADWIIGTGSVKLGNAFHLIFAMQLEEKITLNEYWADPRFEYKKPVINGSLVQMYGDNFYHQDPDTNEWIQENSAHSMEGGIPNEKQVETDKGGKYALISQNFCYLGDESVLIPDEYRAVCSEGRGMKGPGIPIDIGDAFILWIKNNFHAGIHGDPISWREHLMNKD